MLWENRTQVLETLSPGDCKCTQQVFRVFIVLGQERQISPAEVSDCMPFWAASVCSCCKKAKKHLIPRIDLLGSGLMQQMVGYQAVGNKGP